VWTSVLVAPGTLSADSAAVTRPGYNYARGFTTDSGGRHNASPTGAPASTVPGIQVCQWGNFPGISCTQLANRTGYGGKEPVYQYRITVSGALGEVGREVLADLKIADDGADTVLTGDLDEAALYGVLNRLLALGLKLVELKRSPAPDDLTLGE